jgi:hypothetical protein
MKIPIAYALQVWAVLTITCCYCSSCKDELITANEYSVSEQDAAEVISNSILPTYGGLISTIRNTINLTQSAPVQCGVSNDTTLVNPLQNNISAIEFNYKLHWRYYRMCNDPNMQFSVIGDNNYNGIHYSAKDVCNGLFLLTPKTLAQINLFKIKVLQTRTGNIIKKDIGNKTFSYTINLQSDSINVDRKTGNIISGKIVISFFRTSASAFNYMGDFDIIDNHKATLKIHGGAAYNLSW